MRTVAEMTDRYTLPAKGEHDWHQPLNENFAGLEDDVEFRGSTSNRDEYEPRAGRKYYTTDTGTVFIGDGSSWIPIVPTVGDTQEYVVTEYDGVVYGYGPEGVIGLDTDAATVINAVTDAIKTSSMSGWRHARIVGNFEITETVELEGPAHYEFGGTLTLADGANTDVLSVESPAVFIDAVRIDGNRTGNDSGLGIAIKDNYVWVVDSEVAHCQGNGIDESGGASTIWIQNCVINNNGDAGIYLPAAADAIISDCQIGFNDAAGISMAGGYNTITNCQVFISGDYRNDEPGIAVIGTSHTISNCRVNHSGGAGIFLWEAVNCTFSNLSLLRNGQVSSGQDAVGIEDAGGTSDCTFVNINGNNHMPEAEKSQNYTIRFSEWSQHNIFSNIHGRHNNEGATTGDLVENNVLDNVIGSEEHTVASPPS